MGYVEIHNGNESMALGDPRPESDLRPDMVRSFKCAGKCQRFLPADKLELVISIDRRVKLYCADCAPDESESPVLFKAGHE